MCQINKYFVIEFQQFIIAAIVLILAENLNFRYTFNSLKDEVRIENSSSPAEKEQVFIKAGNKQDQRSKVSHYSEYILKDHFSLITLKFKNSTFQPANQTPTITHETGSIRITQFDEL